MIIRPRQTFLMKSGPLHDPERLHLHFVCLDVDDDGNTLIVPVASYKENYSDSTCILDVGDHEFIKHKSFVLYLEAQIRNADELQADIDERVIIPQKDILQYFLLKIRKGVLDSKETPRNIKDYCKSRMQGKR